ncbi:nitrate- and nitrite sensing domain-containing protein [Streptomyces sp. NPDC001848]|uniref:nitrate- and nitrite sensing domain-containing protein n=1 Tax=Streptomyces sp. NPDC001848 TaxID=3364618 RepID=UPI0036AEFAE0
MDVTPPTTRARLLRFLVLALAVLLSLLGAAAAQQIAEHRDAAVTADHAQLEIAVQGLVHELQKERGLTTGYVGGVRQFGTKLLTQRKATDAARARLERASRGRDDAAASLRASLGRLDGLTAVRRRADDGTGTVQETFASFSAGITVLDRLEFGLGDVYDVRVRTACQALRILGDAKESIDEERAIVLGSVRAGRFRGDDYGRFLQLRAARLAALESFRRYATAARRRGLDAVLGTPEAERALAYESVAVHADGRLGTPGIPPMAWWESMTSTDDGLRAVQISLGKDVEERAAALESAAQRDLLLFVLFALGTVAVLGHLALDCVRSVSTPLAALAQQALEVAATQLPRAVAAVRSGTWVEHPGPPAPLAVPGRAGAEVRDVAEAFDRVQRVAFDLATEQGLLRPAPDGGGEGPFSSSAREVRSATC